MDQDRWKKVNRIFHAALEVSAPEREEFVGRVADGDSTIADEVNRLLKADADAGSYIEAPAMNSPAIRSLLRAATPPLQAGDVLCERFRIVRNVGEGGMGQVFEAADTELGVQVALKTVRTEIANNPQVLARFRQEVRLARKITHPNVCRTFDLERETRVLDASAGAKQEILFLTMEFLEGETLAGRIRREGPLPVEQALEVARQVASGLDAARALGVVHRDIKPANVMLVGGGMETRAVITDFGLARVDAAEMLRSSSDITSRAHPIGTLAYMAPEQLENGAISSATDVYAFGLLLFEMVTGKRAFPSDTLLSGIAQRLSGTIPQARAVALELPGAWAAAIEGCLRVKPEDRFATAAEAVAVLDGVGRGHRSSMAWRRWRLRASTSKQRLIAAMMVSAAAVALFWSGLRYSSWKGDPHVTPGALVYLAPVKNETGEKALDNITELIRVGLAQSAQINLLDQNRVGDTLQHMEKTPDTVIDEPIAREIAMRNEAVRVVFGTVRGSRGKYRLDIDVQQPDNTPEHARNRWSRSFFWQSGPGAGDGSIPQPLLNAIRDASDWTRLEVGESVNDIARLNAPPEDVTTGNWQALQDYTQSERLAGSNRVEGAVLALQRAVKQDPSFALAWARQGDLLLSLGLDLEGYGAYEKALDVSDRNRLTRKEEDRIRGMRAVDTADYDVAVQAFHDYALNYPNDYAGWTYPLRALRMLGRNQEAIDYLNRAISIDPRPPFAPFQLAIELLSTGRREEALHWAQQLRTGNPDLVERIDAFDAMLQGQYDRAAEIIQRAESSSSSLRRSYAQEEHAALLADRGMYIDAIEVLNRGLAQDMEHGYQPGRARKLVDRAYLEARTGRLDDCIADVNSAVQLTKSPWTILAAETAFGNAATAAASGRHALRAAMRQLDQQLSEISGTGAVFELAKMRFDGELELIKGNPKAAVEMFRRASMKDAPFESREYLGRALAALAVKENTPTNEATLREAYECYGVTALRPALIWYEPSNYLPGYYGDQLESFVAIGRELKINDSAFVRAEDALRRLRPHSYKQM